MDGMSVIKLVKKSGFNKDLFSEVAPEALDVINTAKDEQVLALTITRNSPLRLAKAEIFTRDVFENILATK